MTWRGAVTRWGAILLPWLAAGLAPSALRAQAVVVEGPTQATLPSLTPVLQARAIGLGPGRPLQFTVQASTTPDFASLVLDSTFNAPDSVVAIQITRPLPSEATVFLRVAARSLFGPQAVSGNLGPYLVPAWLTLISPNSPTGSPLDVRRPLFVWRAAPVLSAIGPWRFDIEIASSLGTEVAASGIRDTTFRPFIDLQANTSYRWNLRASLPNAGSIRVLSAGTFQITDPSLPTTTLLYQNFPNPFPTAASQTTCFWFDVGEPGASIALDVLDLRGNLVKRIVPASDGVRDFAPGRYGRGQAGGASNCDNRFVWDATADDGRSVAPGVYLARFRAGTGAPIFRRIVFLGR